MHDEKKGSGSKGDIERSNKAIGCESKILDTDQFSQEENEIVIMNQAPTEDDQMSYERIMQDATRSKMEEMNDYIDSSIQRKMQENSLDQH